VKERQQFLKSLTTRLTAVALAVLLVLPASAAQNTVSAVATQNAAAACVHVAELNVFEVSASLNPYDRSTSGELIWVVNNVYERLVDQDTHANPVPRLATSWSHNADATQWTFQLRKGVRFDDGHELTSQDVVYSYQLMLDPKNGYAAVHQLPYLTPSGVSAAGRYAVTFTTTQPVVELPLSLSFFEGVIVPSGATKGYLKTHADGTGPFTLPSWQAGNKTVHLVANAHYWRAGVPKSSCVDVQEVQDATARAVGVESGQLDVDAEVDLLTVGSLKATPQVHIVASPPVISLVIWMWTDTPPFNNPNVRRALKLVVDRDFMVRFAELGYAVAGDDDPIPPTWPSAWRHTYPKQNLAQAKALLAAAGYSASNPLKVTLYASEIQPGALTMATAYKAMAAQAGVVVTIDNIPLSTYWDTIWLKQPMGLSSWGVRAPAQGLPLAYTCNASFKETHWCNKQYDRLLNQASATLESVKRAALYKQAEQLLAEDGGVINVLFFENLSALRSRCSGYASPFPFYEVDLSTIQCT
jgi:peptide/nickel transport system substrate-binding protein